MLAKLLQVPDGIIAPSCCCPRSLPRPPGPPALQPRPCSKPAPTCWPSEQQEPYFNFFRNPQVPPARGSGCAQRPTAPLTRPPLPLTTRAAVLSQYPTPQVPYYDYALDLILDSESLQNEVLTEQAQVGTRGAGASSVALPALLSGCAERLCAVGGIAGNGCRAHGIGVVQLRHCGPRWHCLGQLVTQMKFMCVGSHCLLLCCRRWLRRRPRSCTASYTRATSSPAGVRAEGARNGAPSDLACKAWP